MKDSNNQVPPDEGFELSDGDYDEEWVGEGEENNPENTEIEPSENIENENVNTKEPTDLVLLTKSMIPLMT